MNENLVCHIEKHRVWVLQTMLLTRLFGPHRKEATLRWEKVYVLRIFMTYNHRQILLKLSHYEIESGRACGTHGADAAYRNLVGRTVPLKT